MLFPPLWVNQMEGLVPSLEAILDERAKDTMLLIHAVEECAHVTMLAEGALGNL
jgi:hypothetical protein